MSVLAFIPARGGSKGIPRKNLAPLQGKPLIQYTIEAVQGSSCIDAIFLSSDDPEIVEFAESVGLCVPYRRPAKLAEDTTPIIETVLHGLKWLKKERDQTFDSILLLQPTSPLRGTKDIDLAVKQFVRTHAESLISVHVMGEHPYECLKSTSSGWNLLQKPDKPLSRRQDYANEYYFINGAIYLATPDFLVRERSFFREGQSALFVMPSWRGIDVDVPLDLKLCEFYLNLQKE